MKICFFTIDILSVDGRIPSLACGTTGGKILIHSPHEVELGNSAGQLNSVRFLNLNRKITSLASGGSFGYC
jgi:Bardet-Biedl syndrome 2 protein